MEWRDGDDWPNWLNAALSDTGVVGWLRSRHDLFSKAVCLIQARVVLDSLGITPEEAAALPQEDLLAKIKGSEAFEMVAPLVKRNIASRIKAASWMDFRQQLIEKFPRPSPLTKLEVWDSIETSLLNSDSDFDRALRDLGDALYSKCCQGRTSGKLLLARTTADETGPAQATILQSGHMRVMWDRIESRETIPFEACLPNENARVSLYGRVYGDFSAGAIKLAVRELAKVIRTALIAALDIEHPEEAEAHPRIPRLKAGALKTHPEFVRKILSAYYSADAKKDSMARRIRNCVSLMVEAHGQVNEAIALALYCSAMEALLGRKGADIASTLADNVAALIEPDPRRRADAVDFVKNLYDTRSRILHGERLSADDKSLRNARCLAGAILVALMDRGEFFAKAGFDTEKPDDLLAELRKARFTEGQSVGSRASQVVSLWRNSPEGPKA